LLETTLSVLIKNDIQQYINLIFCMRNEVVFANT